MPKPWVPHVIQQGEHIRKLAYRYGVDPNTLWKHDKNKDLAAQRKNMDLVAPGDVLHVPAEPLPGLDITVGGKNRYKATIPSVPVSVHLASPKRSLTGQAFEVHGAGSGGEPIRGTTDGSGVASFEVPVIVREVEVRLPDAGLLIPVHIGDLDPIEEPSGAAQRLQNLGFLPAGEDLTPEQTESAIRAFQREHGLPETGGLDEATKKALQEKHLL